MRNNLNTSYELIAVSPHMLALLEEIDMASQHDENVLITGETGTGKELVARQIHKRSERAEYPFEAINCGAIPKDLIESELFGYEKGAFTGASYDGKKGRVELADRGTLFLDELSTMPLDSQTRLLRFIEEGVVQRVGGVNDRRIDARFISAINEEPSSDSIREDLFYRLNVVTLNVPPLRDRVEDIGPIAQFYLKKMIEKYRRQTAFSDEALEVLKVHEYPGNVRELENTVRYAFLHSRGESISPDIVTKRFSQRPYKKK